MIKLTLERKEYFKKLRDRERRKNITVKRVWFAWEYFNTDFSYNMAGLFIEELIAEFGKEKFLEFFTNQSYKNAQKVFGKGFDDFVKSFEEKYNLKKS